MKRNKINIINKILSCYTFFSGYKKGRADECNNNDISCIVIYSTTALGDLILNTPAIHALRKKFPHARLVLVSSPKNKELVHNSALFDEVIYWNNKFNNIIYFIYKLRRLRPQLAVILHSYFPYDILSVVLAGCRYIFRDHYGSESPALNPWLTAYSQKFEGHTVQRKLNLLQPLGCDTTAVRMAIPVVIPHQAKPLDRVRVGFQLGASRDFRRWPPASFAALSRKLMDQDSTLDVVLIGGKNELSLVDDFMALIPADNRRRVISLVGKTSLLELAAAITTFDTLVTGDTGPLHLAIAQQVRTVSLFVTANPLYTGPYQDQHLHHVFYKPLHTLAPDLANSPFPMTAITVDEVFAAVRRSYRRGQDNTPDLAMSEYHYGT
ncbi:glycosyltransferase family 9 protein [Sodalis sp. C49]|uniref:glycosyltransferase family 9 protein n=1 Tax=unclassified Sodalis (in: enterobacteria) TaxID=2636512 RepID=UPI003965CA96